MCGIAGSVQTDNSRVDESTLLRVAQTLHHRGPDDRGIWQDRGQNVALVHTRLAILDLSPLGRQPMHSPCGRFTIVYNGEIYNHEDLRRQLPQAGCEFRGRSDTETVLAAISHWGLETALSRFVGMFAFALWDRDLNRLTLVRDRLGVKPLYYRLQGRRLLFGSELKALAAFPGWSPAIDECALAQFLRTGYVPAPLSIYEGVRKLPPGYLMHVEVRDEELRTTGPAAYWSLANVIEAARSDSGPRDWQQALEGLEERLTESVRARMISDVPLGAFLSGGIDSSTIVALMQAVSPTPIKTFTVGFDERSYDESARAAQFARRLGTDHYDIRIPQRELLGLIDDVPWYFDEPFADESKLPTLLLSRFARRHVTVALSGDGGDELFGGYTRHAVAHRLGPLWNWIPASARQTLGCLITSVSPTDWDRFYGAVEPALPPALHCSQLGDKLQKLGALLRCDGSLPLHQALPRHWPALAPARSGAGERFVPWPRQPAVRLTNAEQMMYCDACAFLPDDVLTKVDRASMATGLEVRVPILDHRVVEYAWSLPLHMKIRRGAAKLLLRKLLGRLTAVEDQPLPKMGFNAPLAQWLRGPLREWAGDLLEPSVIRRQGLLDAEAIGRLWKMHLNHQGNYQHQLWSVLMFQAWRQRWMDSIHAGGIAA